jgi:hypothetical protein
MKGGRIFFVLTQLSKTTNRVQTSQSKIIPFPVMFPTFSFWLSLLFAFNFVQNTDTSPLGNETDNLALLKFKESNIYVAFSFCPINKNFTVGTNVGNGKNMGD